MTISDIGRQQIYLSGFTLNSDKTIKIKAVGAGGDKKTKRIYSMQEDPDNMFAYAWIIDARTRGIKWRMTISNTKGDWWKEWNRAFEGNVTLEKGEYELYFVAIKPSYLTFDGSFPNFGQIIDQVFGGDNSWWEGQVEKWKVSVEGVDEVFQKSAVLKYQHAVKNSAIVSLTEIQDSERKTSGFSLSEPTRLNIYAIGEGYKKEMVDYAYIIDANSRSRVWEMKERDTEHAGGAIKNRKMNEDIFFEAGDYLVYYETDGNHSFEEWNANPPYDPHFWGVTIRGVGENFDRSIVTEFEETIGSTVISLTRLGNYEEVSEGFTVLKPIKLRIYAIGEITDDELFDYGWIEDARTGRTIWKMNYRNTEHAGGASKNRMYDGIIKFEPGSYIAYFKTDDSHSYRDWNSAKPRDPESWGLQIYPVGKKGSEEYIKKYSPDSDRNILVQLIRVGDDEHVKKQFTLKQSGDVRVYAIGEGDWDEMYDYAWIEDFNTGRTVWKMKYRETRDAGGASKNRLFDSPIYLKAGTYIAHYQSDDSHSYSGWNSSPPRNKTQWGITIYSHDN